MKRIQNNSGSMLIISLFVMTILVGFGGALAILSSNEKKNADRQKISAQAFYIAEAGLEKTLYNLQQDFEGGGSNPSWVDGTIRIWTVDSSDVDADSFYSFPDTNDSGNAGFVSSLGEGTYSIKLKSVSGSTDAIWIRSSGTVGDTTETIEAYAKAVNVSPWENAIFAGAGASGAMINGNVDVRGSVHILGTGLTSTDMAIDMGGTAQLVGNNYETMPSDLKAKVPALSTVIFGGETVETLNAEVRIKQGKVGLSGSASIGAVDVSGGSPAVKETADGVYITDGYDGTAGISNVHSDNGGTNGYDLEDAAVFPSLADPAPEDSSQSRQAYFKANALVLTTELAAITPTSAAFTYTDGTNTISKDAGGNLTITGRVYVDGNNSVSMDKAGSDKTITYTGSGSLLVTGNIQIDVNLVTDANGGNASFPVRNGSQNIVGFMTPNNIGFGSSGGANIDVMGLFYAENQITVAKQTDIVGTVVTNYFDGGGQVPAIYQVPDASDNLPPGMIDGSNVWYTKVLSWQKI